MKKTLAILIALCICLVCATAFATPPTVESFKFYVADNFDGLSGAVPCAWANSQLVDGVFVDDAIKIYTCSGPARNYQMCDGSWQTPGFTAPAAVTGMEGIMMYVANTTESAIYFTPHFYNGNALAEGVVEAPYYTIVDGTVTPAELEASADPNWEGVGFFVIPAGFEGYMLCPFSSMNDSWAHVATADFNAGLISFISLDFDAIDGDSDTGKALTIDDWGYYGFEDTMVSNVVYDTASKKLVEPSQSTADLSVIAYAAAAIVGCGALVVGKKKH